MDKEIQNAEKWQVSLEIFEGPLDLLLHLINKFEIDIYDIPVAEITTQYMEYIHTMELLKLEIAGDYLVMAATLMSIKSQMLLPRSEGFDEEGEDFLQEDPREELMERLLEYRKFKNAAEQLESREEERSVYFTKDPTDLSEFQNKIPLRENEIDLSDLMTAFKEMLVRKELREPNVTTIESENVTVSEKMIFIENQLRRSERIKFNKLIDQSTKTEMVVTFLALLELIKENKVIFEQKGIHEEIELSFLKK